MANIKDKSMLLIFQIEMETKKKTLKTTYMGSNEASVIRSIGLGVSRL